MLQFYKSTIGKKIIVAGTGLILFGFVMGHLAGNLQIFMGPDVFNAYADFLKHTKGLLWGTRIVLLASVTLHIIATVQLTRHNRKSRPIAYAQRKDLNASAASRTMIYGGLFLLAYIIFHLLHLTLGTAHPEFSHTDVYSNVVIGFSNWMVSGFYVLGMVALGMHLYHGVWSIFQTLGLNHPKYNCARSLLAHGAAWVIATGYSLIPISVLLGVVK